MTMNPPRTRRAVVGALLRAGGSVRGASPGRRHELWQDPCGRHRAALPTASVLAPGAIASVAESLPCLEKGWLS